MEKTVKLVNQLLAWFSVILSVVLVICVVWQVISRYVLGAPSIVTDELARFLFMWVGLIGAAYATGAKRHLAIDLLLLKLKKTKKRLLEVIILLVMCFFAGYILIYGGSQLAWDTHLTGQVSPSLQIDMGLVYLCLPISGTLMLFYLVVELIQKFTHTSNNSMNKE
ncbi:TRAP transporter small permease [Pasteurella skyensis]|uniref:TRAP transporter small permease protein n=1 Tax=Phocoenobacter skyensis TaxID=97481 RepID=A0AAJ6NDJ3_9PAST|nr:TRAP transporter small permease [Pasteurella skyensis]MDP8170681.1 TRAP transporter small permease [Pasteurella skyensis]MDP8174838.1 TRAP transporter small permease [Pasteurella skyensis]